MTRFFINEHSASQKHPKVEAKKVRRMAALLASFSPSSAAALLKCFIHIIIRAGSGACWAAAAKTTLKQKMT
jgi:hypothetical protein